MLMTSASRVDILRVSVSLGLKLGCAFEDAGLPTPQMLLGARVERGLESPAYHQIAEVTRTLLPLMERTGVATADEVDIDTLASRLKGEALALRATHVAPSLVGAWTRKPHATSDAAQRL
jgi:hypothetical protein